MFQNHRAAGLLVAGIVLFGAATAAFGQANVNLNTWLEVTTTNANWDVAPDGLSVTQTVNGAPTVFLSPNTFFNTTIEGRFRVATASDDDFIGFVFGLTAPTEPGSTIDALLLDWKKGVQSGANAGFRLSYVTGDVVNSTSTGSPYWSHSTTTGTTIQALGTFAGATADGRGWVANTDYGFTLQYSATDISVAIQGGSGVYENGLEIFNINVEDPAAAAAFPGGSFPDGRFGFYNFSQAQVVYESFTQTDDPVLGTLPTPGGTLDFGNVRVTGSGDAQLSVTNNGGIGSTLLGAVPTPANPLFTLNTAPDTFSLEQGNSALFDYSFAPAARGLVTETVNVSSNDPAAPGGVNITLSGRGVGPVFDALDLVEFGEVDAHSATTAILSIANITTDGALGGLTDLTLRDIVIGGEDAGYFSLLNFDPNQTLAAGDVLDLEVQFTGDGTLGDLSAFLTLLTDEGAALGAVGSQYEVNLTSVAVPEPTTLGLLSMGLAFFLRRRAARP